MEHWKLMLQDKIKATLSHVGALVSQTAKNCNCAAEGF
jgi:hypothetical protein